MKIILDTLYRVFFDIKFLSSFILQIATECFEVAKGVKNLKSNFCCLDFPGEHFNSDVKHHTKIIFQISFFCCWGIQAILLQSPCVLDPIEIFTRNIPELLNVLSSESTVILFKSLCALTSAHSPSALEQVVSAIKMHINHVFGSFQEQVSKKRISTENVERISR